MSSSDEKNVIDDKHNSIRYDSEFISHEAISDSNAASSSDQDTSKLGSRWERFIDSFREMERPEIDPNMSELDQIAFRTANAPLQQRLKSRHLQMIAIGGAIGTGLFVGSGTALRTAGPAGILIGWGLTGTMIYSMVMSLGELSVVFPISGGFTTFATRFIDESFGFANNINYMLQWLVVLPLEIVAASITVNYWGTDPKYRDGFVALFWVVIVCINFFGVKGYAEAEFIFSFIKVITVI